jgi:hypothetical protein
MEQPGRTGSGLGDFQTYGMFLPSEERIARHMQRPLNRGPHLTNNAVVVEGLDGLH